MLELLQILVLFYSLGLIAIALTVSRAKHTSRRDYRPRVSVIIAARNEEPNIGSCLDAASRLTYPKEMLEVIVIDDRSEDRTSSIIAAYAERFPFIKRISAVPGSGQLQGKMNAVTQGIDVSRGEILMFSDADCRMPDDWVEETVKYYVDEGVGLVAGFTSLVGKGGLAAVQALDWFGLFSVAAGATQMGFPVTAVGTNLSVRRAAYDEVGGYRKIPFSVTEDYALFHAVTTQTSYLARFPLDARTLVESKPCATWKDLYRQRKRWLTGGRGMDLKYLGIFVLVYLMNLLLLLGIFFLPTLPYVLALLAKIAADLIVALPSLITFRRLPLVRYFLHYEFYFILYVVYFPLIVLLGRHIIWKERSLRSRVRQQKTPE